MKKIIVCLIIILSVNLNSQWLQQVLPGDVNMVLSIDLADLNNGVAGGWNTGFFGRAVYTTNSGTNWLLSQIPDSSRSLVSVQMINSQTGYFGGAYNIIPSDAAGNSIISCFGKSEFNSQAARIGLTKGADEYSGLFLKTTNGGVSWFTHGTLPLDVDYILSLSFLNINTGFAVVSISPTGSKCRVLKTTNGGLSWQSLVTVDTVYLHKIHTLDGVTINVAGTNGELVTGSNGFILKTTNSGTNWVVQNLFYAASIESVTFPNSTTGFACGMDTTIPSKALILKTTNSGVNWQPVTLTGSNDQFLYCIEFFGNTGRGLSIGSSGSLDSLVIYSTTTFGTNWYKRSIPSSVNLLVSSSLVDQNNWFVCGGFNNGLIYKTPNGGAIGLQQIGSQVPGSYTLSQNYPNPFNPSTSIKFQIPNASHVRLIIYDILGDETESLLDEYITPGNYEIDWNASESPSGVYFYRLIAEGFTETKKMILLK